MLCFGVRSKSIKPEFPSRDSVSSIPECSLEPKSLEESIPGRVVFLACVAKRRALVSAKRLSERSGHGLGFPSFQGSYFALL